MKRFTRTSLQVLVMGAALCGYAQEAAKAPAIWPGSQDGLTFAFATGHFKTPTIAFDKDGKRISSAEFPARARARYDRNFALVTSGGSFVLKGGEEFPVAASKKSGAFTLEAYVAPFPAAATGTGEILSLSVGADSRNFALVQDKNKLRLSLRTSATKEAGQTVELCTLPDAKPYHLTVNYTNGILTCFINGKEAAKLDTVKGDLGNWEAAHLVFGDNWTASRNWPGTLEGVALFSRALSATEAAQDAETYTKKATRRVLPVLRVKGKLLAKSPVPSLQKIAPYYQSLVTYTYEVEKVIEGKYEEKNIRVAHWGLMEKKVLPEIADRKIDQSYEFELQPMNSNRQLESQWLEDTLETSDLPLFYDVTP